MKEVVKIFKALSDSNRLRILKMLEVRSLCVCEITDILQLAPSTVSKHLAILREAGLIVDSKDGKWVNYALSQDADPEHPHEIVSLVQSWLATDKTVIADMKAVSTVDRNQLCSTQMG